MSKATQVQSQAPVVPSTVGKRELFAWAIVLAFVFSTFGVVSGWFIHANAVSSTPAVVHTPASDNGGTVSKPQLDL